MIVDEHLTYRMSPTMEKFHECTAEVRSLMGPIGSGKSVACVMDLNMLAQDQAPDQNGVRNTRWAIIRNTYRELIDTTMETFFQWVPKRYGAYRAGDMKFILCYDHPSGDGTLCRAEFLFRALDKPDDIKKLLSLELTGGWINEAREIPKQVLDMLIGRVGRYPNTGVTWSGIIMDTNPPDSDHWWYRLFEESHDDNYRIFKQPSGLSDEAENLENLLQPPAEERNALTLEERRAIGRRYYERMLHGKDQEWINVYVHGQYGFISDGKPVYPEYNDDTHFTELPFTPDISKTIYVGIDFGLTPAALFGQRTASGRWFIFDELVCEDMGAKNFGHLLSQHVKEKYPQHKIEFYGDPSGDFRAQTDEVTPFQILQACGINATPTYTNDFIIRREAAAAPMMRLDFAGNPGFALTPGAPMARKGFAGGYKYKRMAVTGADRFQDKPDKGRYSHVCEAGQYLMVGAGEGLDVIKTDNFNQPIDYSKIDRLIV